MLSITENETWLLKNILLKFFLVGIHICELYVYIYVYMHARKLESEFINSKLIAVVMISTIYHKSNCVIKMLIYISAFNS